jgi:hypothetical protein
MHFHWLAAHLHMVFVYGYEIIGGILIFVSSAVTEHSMPPAEKRKHWIVFGGIALCYIFLGIGIRHDDVQQTAGDRDQAKQDRQDLRDLRTLTDSRTSTMMYSFQTMYSEIASLELDQKSMEVDLTRAMYKNDPRQMSDLADKAQSSQQRASALSQELLALTMAPQVADQLRDWKGESDFKQQDLHARAYEEEMHFVWEHPNDNKGRNSINQKWDVEYDAAAKEYQEKLKAIWANADFVRKELLQRLPPQQRIPDDAKDFDSLTNEAAAHYLEILARRVPPPPKT